jgi:hypothetical protein
MYLPASSRVTSWRARESGIGSSNWRCQPRSATSPPGLWLLVPIKVRPDVGAFLAAKLGRLIAALRRTAGRHPATIAADPDPMASSYAIPSIEII